MNPYYADDHVTLYHGDCREVLPTLPDGSVHCVVTSPPYWGLRDYGTDGQLGLEPTPEAYVANMVAVFREVRRVLRSDGTVWLNLGDSYNGYMANQRATSISANNQHARPVFESGRGRRTEALKAKDLVGIPWRVAFALQADGWYLRSDIIWSKPNPMPESVTDRPTKSHEYLFLLSKSPRYHFDQEAVREQTIGQNGHDLTGPGYAAPGQTPQVGNRDRFARHGAVAQHVIPGQSAAQHRPDRTDHTPLSGRNIRSVWTIPTHPYPGAHFATFPEKLVVPCIKAGTSERGVCAECGAPWERMTTPRGQGDTPPVTTGWRPTCAHSAPVVPAVVLDPFGGSGTVGMVAEKLSRRAVLIELSPEYVRLASERLAQVGMGLSA